MDIYICRHGEYENPHDILPFRLPGFPLSKKGQEQARIIAKKLLNKSVVVIVTSPMLRCRQTADIIQKILNVHISISKDLLENFSPFQGMKRSEYYKKKYNLFNNEEYLAKGGESIESIFRRMNRCIERLRKHYHGKNVLVVSHGDPIICLIGGLMYKNLNATFLDTLGYMPKGGLIKLQVDT